jgi:hypothetical protein
MILIHNYIYYLLVIAASKLGEHVDSLEHIIE